MILRGRLQLAPPLFYVATKAKKPVLNEVLVKHDNITDIPTYLRLCGRPHKRKFVAMSVMGSMALKVPPVRFGCDTRRELLASSAESVGTKLAQIAEGMYVSMNLDGQFL